MGVKRTQRSNSQRFNLRQTCHEATPSIGTQAPENTVTAFGIPSVGLQECCPPPGESPYAVGFPYTITGEGLPPSPAHRVRATTPTLSESTSAKLILHL